MTESSNINVFNVHGKTLELANYEGPSDKGDAYQINKGEIKNRDQLLDYCDLLMPLRTAVYDLSHIFFEDKPAESDSYEDIEEFLEQLDEEEINILLKNIDEWIDTDLDDNDYDLTAMYHPFSGYDYAFYLFEGNSRSLSLYNHEEFNVNQVVDALNIYVVEGDHPGSSYLGAELGISVDEANNISSREGFPVKFVKSN